jgi:SAM-dependent methyltransferase
MNTEAFEILRELENTWWHKGRKAAVMKALSAVGTPVGGSVFDVGAGYGGMFDALRTYGEVDGSEPETEARAVAETRGYRKFFGTHKDALVEGAQYSLIGAFDVIEHIEDDVQFVQELAGLTKEGGYLVATVPAFQFLWGPHDVTHMHFRRHTTASMRKLLEGAGYEICYARYWNVFLFPVALVMRLLGRSGESGLHPYPLIRSVLQSLIWVEVRVVRYLPIPFGLSVVIVGKKI